MVRLLKEFPNVVGSTQASAILQRHITPENIAKDIDYLRANTSWERPYGWNWLLKLVLELQDWEAPIATPMTTALKPLAEELSKMYVLRRILTPMGVTESMEFLLDKLKGAKTNDDFFESMNT